MQCNEVQCNAVQCCVSYPPRVIPLQELETPGSGMQHTAIPDFQSRIDFRGRVDTQSRAPWRYVNGLRGFWRRGLSGRCCLIAQADPRLYRCPAGDDPKSVSVALRAERAHRRERRSHRAGEERDRSGAERSGAGTGAGPKGVGVGAWDGLLLPAITRVSIWHILVTQQDIAPRMTSTHTAFGPRCARGHSNA